MADESLQRLYHVLVSTWAVEKKKREEAEAVLREESFKKGYSTLLARLALSAELPVDVRQLAAVVLKNFLKRNWSESETAEIHLDEDDKERLRELLPFGLRERDSKLRTSMSVAIATIACCEWPSSWPGLLDQLVSTIRTTTDIYVVRGCLQCLSVLADELDEQQVHELSSLVVPELVTLLLSPSSDLPCQRLSLEVLRHLLSSLSILVGAKQREVHALMVPMVGPITEVVYEYLKKDLQVPANWPLLLGALKVLLQLLVYFSSHLGSQVSLLLGQCWSLFTSGLTLYQKQCVEAEEGEEWMDDEGDGVDAQTLLTQVFEVMMTVVGKPSFSALVQPALGELAYLSVGYMAMTREKEEEWKRDLDAYVADDTDEMMGCRVSAELLLNELVEAFERNVMFVILGAVTRRCSEAAALRQAGKDHLWWRLREAALQALGSVSQHVIRYAGVPKRRKSGSSRAKVVEQTAMLIQSMVTEDLTLIQQGSAGGDDLPSACVFLPARALLVLSRLKDLLDPEVQARVLEVAGRGLSIGQGSGPVHVGACRVVSELCPSIPMHVLKPLLPSLYDGVARMLTSTTEDEGDEVLQLALETMTVLVKVSPSAASCYLSHFAPRLLTVWSEGVGNPVISMCSLELVTALAAIPDCLVPLASICLPKLAEVIAGGPGQQQQTLVEASLDLLRTLLRSSPQEVVLGWAGKIAPSLSKIILEQDDSAQVQNATLLLIVLIRALGRELLTAWSQESSQLAPQAATSEEQCWHNLMQIADHLTSPALDESSSCYAGPLVVVMINYMPDLISFQLLPLLNRVVEKVATTSSSGTLMGLLLVLCRMVMMGNTGELLGYLASIQVSTQQDSGPSVQSGVSLVVPPLLERAPVEMYNIVSRRMLVTTLVALLDCRQHPMLKELQVQGKCVVGSGGGPGGAQGVCTRSQVRRDQQQGGGAHTWKTVSAPVKLVAVLLDIMRQEQGQQEEGLSDDDNEDSDGDRVGSSGTGLPPGTFGTLEEVEALAEGSDGESNDEDSWLAEPLVPATDPLHQMKVCDVIRQSLRQVAQQDELFLRTCLPELTEVQASCLRETLQYG